MKKFLVIGLTLLCLAATTFLVLRYYNSAEVRISRKSTVNNFSESSLAEYLTDRTWSNYLGGGPFSEGSALTFKHDGVFQYSVISDYIDNYSGTWRLIDFGQGTGWLYLTHGTLGQAIRSLVYVQAKNNYLIMDSGFYWGEDLNNRSVSGTSAVSTSVAEIKSKFPEFALLLDQKWTKTTDKYKDSIPHELTFYDNGTFFANYLRDQNCSFTGNWGITSNEPGKVSLLMSAPDSNCDLRGYKGWGMGSGNSFSVTSKELKSDNFDYQNYHR